MRPTIDAWQWTEDEVELAFPAGGARSVRPAEPIVLAARAAMNPVDVEPHAIRLDRDSNGMLLTPEEFDRVEDFDDLFTYELIKGVVIVNPIPSEAECGPNELLGYFLLAYKESHPGGEALDATLPERYVRTEDSRRRADRVIWAGLGRRPDPDTDVPTIAVEFVSRRRRDRRRDYDEKRREYLALGVREYWVFDRFRRTLTVFRPGDAPAVVAEDGSYRTDLLPGFELTVSRIQECADRWADRD